MYQKKLVLLLIIIVSFFNAALFSKEYELLDKILVTVEKDVVTKSEVKKELLMKYPNISLSQIPKNDLEKIEKEILNFLIEKKLILQYAASIELIPSEQEIDLVVQNIINQNKFTIEELEKELIRGNSNILEFRELMRYQLAVQKIKDREIMPYVNISEFEIDSEQKKEKDNVNTEYKISHILIKSDNSNKKEILKEIFESLNKDNFSELAEKYSDGPNAESNGDLGWNKLTDLPEIFIEFIKNAQVGEVSEIIESSNGAHLLKLEEIKNKNENKKIFVKQFKFQQILLKKNYISTDEEQEKKLDNFKNLIIDGLDFNEAVKLYSEDQTQINPKNLDWVNYENLLPEFRNQLDNYPEKKLIGPFKTDLGWHLIKVYDFRNNDISDDASRRLTKITLARKKTELRYIDWLDALEKNSSIKFIKND